jgi:putative membrane-bound dehydrogenase-like protein
MRPNRGPLLASHFTKNIAKWLAVLIGVLLPSPTLLAADAIRVLFLGDNGHHRPLERFEQLAPVLSRRGIELTYTDRITDLNPSNLTKYDAVLLYANIERIEKPEEQALLEYVEGGGGFVPIHCASFCFQNSEPLVALVGAQFQRHGWERMRETVADTRHPVAQGYGGFESWDETYVHHRHNEKDRIVLAYRMDGDEREPWTWVRRHGKGRIFYTAWGHDGQTWSHPGFHNLVERGIRWAAGKDPLAAGDFQGQAPFAAPKMTSLPKGPAKFEYVDVGAKIPNYIPSEKWGEQGEPLREMQKPLLPVESMRRIVVPEGFHVELFAAEPELAGKPLCMTWDERGRLWIGESLDYPNELQPENSGRDRIRICEDTDGNGRADRFTVFAEGLSIPTSIAFARGGVIVHNGTESLFLKDTDGDDRADERTVLLSRWSMRDTHGGPSNMQYGLDNWIWGMQGYNKSAIRVGDKTAEFAQGFHRFRPDGSAIEFVRSTNNNTWGFGISEEGLIFGSTANGNPSVYMPIANRYYERVRGWTPRLTISSIADSNRFRPITDKVRQVDHHGGYTAAAGHALYTARTYPQQYWNRTAFVCEPTGHLVSTFVLSSDGADFHATSPANLLASDDEWVAPIMAEVGPDGCVWVLDWYNYIVQHNPTPEGFDTGKGQAYETDLRDKKHGRVYRVVYDASSKAPKIDLSRATPAELVATLKNDNLFWRRHAQRLLVERANLDVVPKLLEQVRDSSVDAIGLNVGAIHSLWTLNGLGVLDGSHGDATAAAVGALRHPSAGVRRNAVQVLPANGATMTAILDAKLLEDYDSQVRLQTLLALSDMPANADAGRAVSKFFTRPENVGDRWLMEAATSAAAAHAIEFLLAAAAEKTSTTQQVDACRIVVNHLARSASGEETEKLLASLATADPRLAGAIVQGLADGWKEDVSFPKSESAARAVEQLLARLALADRIHLARLAARGGDAESRKVVAQLTNSLFERFGSDELKNAERIEAAELIVAAQPNDADIAERLLDLVTPQAPPELSVAAIGALKESTANALGVMVVERLETMTPSARDAAIDLLLSRPQLTREFLDAAEDGGVSLSDLSLVQKQQLNKHPSRRIRERAQILLEKSAGGISSNRKQVLADFADAAATTGDVANGKVVFTKHCATCHKFHGEGSAIGPDLSGMSVHGKEQLLGHILDPNRDVEGNYQAYIVILEDGRVLNGLLGGESNTSIELIDVEGKRLPILREEIDEVSKTGTSLMPEGFEKQLTRAEIIDLLEFLARRTRFVPLDLRRVATVSSAHGMFQTPGSTVESLVFDDWGIKSFEGVPFYPVDPQDGRIRNAVMLHGDLGTVAPNMPDSVELACGVSAKSIHFLSGVSGWGYPYTRSESVTLIVRLHYADGAAEDHSLKNGVHFADYLGDAEVRGSKRAFSLGRQQLRYFKIDPQRDAAITTVELVKGEDRTAPVVMGVTVEQR